MSGENPDQKRRRSRLGKTEGAHQGIHIDLVTQNNEMVEHLAAISVEQFIKDIPVYQGI